MARKKAENNVAVIPDAEVFEWAVHYILEDSLNCESGKTGKKSEEKPAEKSVESPEKEKPVSVKKSKKTIAEEAQLVFDF